MRQAKEKQELEDKIATVCFGGVVSGGLNFTSLSLVDSVSFWCFCYSVCFIRSFLSFFARRQFRGKSSRSVV